MRILMLAHAFNSLAQRLWVELEEHGHEISLELDINDATTIEAADLARPDLVLAPFLKRAIPEEVWRRHPCLVVHPGPEGDRGPSSLDWAILEGRDEWGVSVIEAEAELDGGPVRASRRFAMRDASKSSLYRHEVSEFAVDAVLEAIADPASRRPKHSSWKPALRQADRAIDWAKDDTATVLRKIRSADGRPGIKDKVAGRSVFLHDAHPADLEGRLGALLARSAGGAVARATRDGAVWIGHMRADEPLSLKLSAAAILGEAAIGDLPEAEGIRDLWYEEEDGVGTLHFPFHNGAMGENHCRRLARAFAMAAARPTRVIVLAGGPDFWSNGLHLGEIEAADSPADESWRTINAINDLCRDIIGCTSHLVIAALQGNAGAGGAFLALAADLVVARDGVVLNPHYRAMGNLYGSEYWTYLLPRRLGEDGADKIADACRPIGAAAAARLGLIDGHFARTVPEFLEAITILARTVAADPALPLKLAEKRLERLADEMTKSLESYRAQELEAMRLNFYGFDPSYHVARHDFIRQVPKSRTPSHLAVHRNGAFAP